MPTQRPSSTNTTQEHTNRSQKQHHNTNLHRQRNHSPYTTLRPPTQRPHTNTTQHLFQRTHTNTQIPTQAQRQNNVHQRRQSNHHTDNAYQQRHLHITQSTIRPTTQNRQRHHSHQNHTYHQHPHHLQRRLHSTNTTRPTNTQHQHNRTLSRRMSQQPRQHSKQDPNLHPPQYIMQTHTTPPPPSQNRTNSIRYLTSPTQGPRTTHTHHPTLPRYAHRHKVPNHTSRNHTNPPPIPTQQPKPHNHRPPSTQLQQRTIIHASQQPQNNAHNISPHPTIRRHRRP